MTDSPVTEQPPQVAEERWIEGKHPCRVLVVYPETRQALVRPVGRHSEGVRLPWCFLWPEQKVLEGK